MPLQKCELLSDKAIEWYKKQGYGEEDIPSIAITHPFDEYVVDITVNDKITGMETIATTIFGHIYSTDLKVDGKWVCRFCKPCDNPVKYNSRIDTRRHELRQHSNCRQFRCLELSCPDRFHQTTHRDTHHKSQHAKVKPEQCNVCRKNYSDKAQRFRCCRDNPHKDAVKTRGPKQSPNQYQWRELAQQPRLQQAQQQYQPQQEVDTRFDFTPTALFDLAYQQNDTGSDDIQCENLGNGMFQVIKPNKTHHNHDDSAYNSPSSQAMLFPLVQKVVSSEDRNYDHGFVHGPDLCLSSESKTIEAANEPAAPIADVDSSDFSIEGWNPDSSDEEWYHDIMASTNNGYFDPDLFATAI